MAVLVEFVGRLPAVTVTSSLPSQIILTYEHLYPHVCMLTHIHTYINCEQSLSILVPLTKGQKKYILIADHVVVCINEPRAIRNDSTVARLSLGMVHISPVISTYELRLFRE